jgi:trans-aconitate 2-methyltransferase
VQTPRPHRYAFGDTAPASQRLGVLAAVFAPTSKELLRSLTGGAAPPRPPTLVLDLGCGPGHTTAMLAEAFPSARVLGIDASPAFVGEATGSAPRRCRFAVADVTRMPLPCAPADVIYGRFLLVHLPDPRATVAAWAGEVAPGGMVVVEEPERIDTDDRDFLRYLELAAAVVADRGGDLYVGHELVDLVAPTGTSLVVQRDAELDVSAGSAASIFSLNLGIWGDDPVLSDVAPPGEVAALLNRLRARQRDLTQGIIRWHMRQVVMMRSDVMAER